MLQGSRQALGRDTAASRRRRGQAFPMPRRELLEIVRKDFPLRLLPGRPFRPGNTRRLKIGSRHVEETEAIDDVRVRFAVHVAYPFARTQVITEAAARIDRRVVAD